MHFENRIAAGELLAKELEELPSEDLFIVSLGRTSVPVARKLAEELDAELALFVSLQIELPGRGDEVIGAINQSGDFVYNDDLPYGVRQELGAEFRGYIEEQRVLKSHSINRIIDNDSVVEPHELTDKIIVLVSDGLESGIVVEAAYQLLKPIRFKQIIAAVPVASVDAIDRLHIRVDQIKCLRVVDEIEALERFYDDDETPDWETAMELINLSVKEK